ELDQPVGQGRLAMVDMRDDREIADVVDGARRHGARLSIGCREELVAGGGAVGRRGGGETGEKGVRTRWCPFVRRRRDHSAARRRSCGSGSGTTARPSRTTIMWPGGTVCQPARS